MIQTAQHTPEPWRIEEEADGNVLVTDEQGVSICRCYQQPHDTWRAIDNALLIAAAPKLRAALLQAVVALNTAPRFRVPGLGDRMDSYKVALLCYRALATVETLDV